MKRSLLIDGTKVVVLSAAALFIGARAARAQVNPQTVKGIAQNGASAAQNANSSAQQGTASKAAVPTQKPAAPAQKTVNAPAKATGQKAAAQKSASPTSKPASSTGAQKNAASATKAVGATDPKKTAAPADAKKSDVAKPATDRKKAGAVAAQKPAEKAEPKKAAAAVEKPHTEEPEHMAYRRDPFSYLVGKSASNMGSTVVLPPGKAGLQVESLLIQGIVSAPEGMIAVVANPQQRVYFLREGDQLFDGSVMKIGLEAITFHEVGHDAFGKATEREVTKRLNASSGELP